ncbi:hypothetical protein LIER_21111 [Lithospermum erythrorhizon]|uniref:Endonuclease/exonuclease/phosphatase domain-containing protein n=1 Tax=Lithospermum erythrorhizon TaxID=34254 RepID=A0AAV3QSF6_LITER
MSILCWNCRGLGHSLEVRSLAGLVTNNKPSLVFLIETKLWKVEWDQTKSKLKLPNALVVDAKDKKGGLALLWPRSMEVDVKSFSSHHIKAFISNVTMERWRFVSFYGHHEVGNRKHSWNLMKIINGFPNCPTIFMGDFNEVFSDDEHVSHRRPRPRWQMENFRQVVRDCGMFDMGYSGFKFTWCNNFTSPNSTRARLDRGLASKDWLDRELDPGVKVFRSIRDCRLELLKWKRESLGKVHSSIQEKQDELDVLNQGSISMASKGRATVLAQEIDKLREADEFYWCQRSRAIWRVKGDRNTAFFHAISAERGKTNLISVLQDGLSNWHREPAQI